MLNAILKILLGIVTLITAVSIHRFIVLDLIADTLFPTITIHNPMFFVFLVLSTAPIILFQILGAYALGDMVWKSKLSRYLRGEQ